MPLRRCTEDGKSGWRWGERGKCYTGPDAKSKAMAQAVAIGDVGKRRDALRERTQCSEYVDPSFEG